MKAERRHELQTNSLALWLRWRFPQLAQEYGTRVLLGVIFLALVVVLVRYRINAPRAAAEEAALRLAAAKDLVNDLKAGVPPGQISGVTDLVMKAMDRSESPQVQALGHLTLGDYFWALANCPDRPEAATQPELYRPALPHDQLLSKAEEAYGKALAAQKEQGYVRAAAHMGLGAVAEQRGFDLDRASKGTTAPTNKHWAVATEQYEAVTNAADAPQVLKDEAKWQLDQIPRLQQPVWLVAATQAAAMQAAATQAAGPEAPIAATTRPVSAAPGTSATTRPAQ